MNPWAGGRFGSSAECVLAPNPGMMTLDGTNTWVLNRGRGPAIVVDPGPLDGGHGERIREVAGEIGVILLTHGHLDHSAGAKELAGRVGCAVRALDPSQRLGAEGLAAGDVIAAGEFEVHVVATPGHTSDSLSFHVPQERAVLTGDTVLGRGTTVVAHPDGKLGAYLDSLDRLLALAQETGIEQIWPGHGPVIDRPIEVLEHYLTHRQARLDQVRQAIATLGESADARQVVELVYQDVDPVLWGAAELSVHAQLDYLRTHRPRT